MIYIYIYIIYENISNIIKVIETIIIKNIKKNTVNSSFILYFIMK